MAEWEIDTSKVIQQDVFELALENYNTSHTNSFSLSTSGDKFSLIAGEDDVYCEGSLQQVAFFWEGYVCGQGDGDCSYSTDAMSQVD